MVDQNGAYLFKKRGVYYFSKRIPSDLKHLYQVERLTQSLRTKCERKARSQSQAMFLKLEDHGQRQDCTMTYFSANLSIKTKPQNSRKVFQSISL